MEMEKTYNPQEFEDKIYDFWCKHHYFEAKVDPNKEPFTIVMPPPNITGQLHMGHALDNAIQDTIIRFKRMQGYSALWLPGTDHASIATEVKIVEKMKEEGITKNDIGRDGFLQRAWEWKAQYGGRIEEQLKKLGASCDWSRLAFTMDEKCSKAVRQVFVKLFDKGLIYRGDRIINWCPSCKTALSDAEVEYEQQASHLWHMRYPYADGSGEIVVATTRPETYFGDTAVAVNPSDERYKDAVGKMLILPLTGRQIPVIADDYVEKDFGSGAVKITPAHDPNDFEVGKRHNLEVIRVMNDDGTMNSFTGKYNGKSREETRELVVKELSDAGYMVKIEDYAHNVGQCYRCGCVAEPIVSKQWFVKMKPLAEPAVKAVKIKKTSFIPQHFEKTYFNWMENVRDWCISRQLWWGHRIPAFYCEDCGAMTVSEKDITVCPKCKSSNIKQDEDVLDTWFSSALWPFSTLGYPKKTADLQYFYPNNLLVTAYDIIFFWVARMIFSGIEHMGEVPFAEVLIHGLVRDEQGRKMSKSLGNGIDPLEIVSKYGADSLRFSLAMGVAPGSDMRYSDKKSESARNFMNKIWNASRFVFMSIKDAQIKDMGSFRLNPADKWILAKLTRLTKEITDNLDKYELGIAAGKLYDFVWNDFCDWYIELCKTAIYSGDNTKKDNAASVLVFVLDKILKLMHPFAPFITEEINAAMPKHEKCIICAKWPEVNKKYRFIKEEQEFDMIRDIIKSVRFSKTELNVAPSKAVKIYIISQHEELIKKCGSYIKKLANVSDIEVIADKNIITQKVTAAILPIGEVLIPLGELVDIDKEIARLKDEYENTLKEIKRAEGMLQNQGFVAKAPASLIEKEKEKLENYRKKAEAVKSRMESYK